MVGTATLEVTVRGSIRVTPSRDDVRLRCASLLKPLLFWAAADLPPLAADRDRWTRLARDAVVASANPPAEAIWEGPGGRALLDRLARTAGVRWAPAATFGRVEVAPAEVAHAYARLALAGRGQEVAAQLLAWMRRVSRRQSFGVREVAASALGVPRAAVAAKCGWFLSDDEPLLRTHVAVLCTLPDGTTRGCVVLTALTATPEESAFYRHTYRAGPEVLGLHESRSGETLRAGVRAALRATSR